MILDVGCGDRPRGTVNTDLNIGWSPHLYERKIKVKCVKNFVRCDAHHLPFRDNVFPDVLCSHTLEHLDNPTLAVKEMFRVANGIIRIIVPCRYHEQIQNLFLPKRHMWALEHHKHFFDKKQLQEILDRLNIKGSIRYGFKFRDAITNFRKYNLSWANLIVFGLIESFLPPTPGELMVTIPKNEKPMVRAK